MKNAGKRNAAQGVCRAPKDIFELMQGKTKEGHGLWLREGLTALTRHWSETIFHTRHGELHFR
jgi:hypothetical protein